MGKKRIFISDVHIGAGRFGDNSDSYQYDWDWLSDEETENFSKFLYFIREQYSENVKEVILIGDIFDNWVFPHDPSTAYLATTLAAVRHSKTSGSMFLQAFCKTSSGWSFSC